jgi:3-deoxy-manno-octulosonate cytidylyltransferase (CMP-KDO synthetase)
VKKIAIIPARMESKRFPGKPMTDIMGIPMIGHCYLRAKLSNYVDEVYVATCNKEIYDYIVALGGKCIYTSNEHERATERIAEAFQSLNEENHNTLIALLQGDEPIIHPNVIEEVLKPIEEGNSSVCNLILPISREDSNNKNLVKVVMSKTDSILYMSREQIPSMKLFSGEINYFRQLGIIGFTAESLLKYISLRPTETEIIESIDMNRFLENDVSIKAIVSSYESDSVDELKDLERVKNKMLHDPFIKHYNL